MSCQIFLKFNILTENTFHQYSMFYQTKKNFMKEE